MGDGRGAGRRDGERTTSKAPRLGDGKGLDATGVGDVGTTARVDEVLRREEEKKTATLSTLSRGSGSWTEAAGRDASWRRARSATIDGALDAIGDLVGENIALEGVRAEELEGHLLGDHDPLEGLLGLDDLRGDRFEDRVVGRGDTLFRKYVLSFFLGVRAGWSEEIRPCSVS